MDSVIIELSEQGLGFGEGQISTAAQIENGTLTAEALQKAREIILHRTECFTTVRPDITDDGCGDGRPAIDTWVVDDEGNEVHYKTSVARAKVFGGGLVVASSMRRTIRGYEDGSTVLGDRTAMAAMLKEKAISYGGHSDDHAQGDKCGCGAIDTYPDITRNIVKYETEIQGVLAELYGRDHLAMALPMINQAFATYREVADSPEFFADAAGSDTMELMKNDHAVIKKLSGGHEEDVFVLNDIEGTTFDQPAFDRMMKEAGIALPVQAFVVDTWRGRMYADAVAELSIQEGYMRPYEELRALAYADFLIRTLAVTATLTAGDLPGYARMREGQHSFALAG